jgi:hypothetical protein
MRKVRRWLCLRLIQHSPTNSVHDVTLLVIVSPAGYVYCETRIKLGDLPHNASEIIMQRGSAHL